MKRIKSLTLKRTFLLFGAFIFVLSSFILISRPVSAAFNANNLMDDGVFDNSGTMTAAQIDSWLNSNWGSASCISTDHGFAAPQPIGYSPTGPAATGGFTYGGDVSAGTVIYDAAKVYGLNPQVLLTTLEKEEGLLDGTGLYGCTVTAYTQALGYNCPDGGSVYQYSGFELYSINGTPVTSTSPNGTCVNNPATAGFSRQVIVAAWQLRYNQERSEGNVNWNVQVSNFPQAGDIWDNSDDPPSCYAFLMTQGTFERSTSSNPCPYSSSPPGNQAIYYSGSAVIDGTTIQLDNGATASLYDYTPHFAGNENFDTLFEQYFGGIYASPYVASYFSQSPYPSLSQGQQTTVYISYQNLGSQPWYDDNSLGTAPSGTDPVHLATSSPINRVSSFSSGWPSPNRPDVNFSAVYLSDGATLAPNQNVVQPGQIAEFSFTLTDPQTLVAGTYQEYFQPVVEGTSGLFNDPGTYINVTILPSNNIATYTQISDPTIYPTDTQSYSMMFANTGNVPLYDSSSISSAPSGSYPTHLAISCPMNTNSPFADSSWANPSRPAINFAAVYLADGQTLAPNQHIAQPGQIVKFTFNFYVPSSYASGTYTVCLQPVLEGTSDGTYGNLNASTSIVVPSASVVSYSMPSTQVSMVSGEPGSINLTIFNNGNTSLAAGSTLTVPSASAYQSPSWSNATSIETITQSIAAGSSASISVPYLAPTVTSTTTGSLDIQMIDSSSNLVHDSTAQLATNIAAPVYAASYAGQSAYPSLTYGQTATIFFKYKNVGNKPWYDDSSLASATSRDPLPTHLATYMPMNRPSGFDYNWVAADRPALNFSAVYGPDGITLASNQDVVQPGQIGQFTFTIAVDNGVQPGTYTEYFQPIIEGTSSGDINFQGTYMNVTVNSPVYSASYYSQSAYPTITPGQSTSVFLEYKNTGNIPWFDNNSYSSAPGNANLYPIHLGTSHNLNRNSVFVSSGWYSASRPALNFNEVYNSDGTTLSSNQDVVQPGQIAKFSFNLSAPSNLPLGIYQEFFQPIAEGTMYGGFNDPWTFLYVTVQ